MTWEKKEFWAEWTFHVIFYFVVFGMYAALVNAVAKEFL